MHRIRDFGKLNRTGNVSIAPHPSQGSEVYVEGGAERLEEREVVGDSRKWTFLDIAGWMHV